MTTDFDESDNVARSNAERLDSLISDGQGWSKTHRDPQWHDTQAGLDSWIENKMPNYEKTFKRK